MLDNIKILKYTDIVLKSIINILFLIGRNYL